MVRDDPEKGCRDSTLKVHWHSIEGELGASRRERYFLQAVTLPGPYDLQRHRGVLDMQPHSMKAISAPKRKITYK